MSPTAGSLVLGRGRLLGREDLVDMVVQDGRITTVTPSGGPLSLPRSAGSRLDVEGRLVLPGFVNAHAHLDKAFLTHTASGADYQKGLLVSGYDEVKRGYTVEDVQERARAALDWSVRTGTTAIRTHVDVDPYARLVAMEAIIPLRAQYADRIDIQVVTFAQAGFGAAPVVADMMAKACTMGADLVGGKPSADDDFAHHIDVVLDFAAQFGLGVDLHVDTNIELDHAAHVDADGHPQLLEAAYLAKCGPAVVPGPLTASHLCGLDTIPPPLRERTIELLRDADVSVVACPASNLYCMGREDTHNVRRGIAPVRELLDAGVTVAVASDNFGDAYNLYASPDMMVHALLAAMACRMQTVEDLHTILDLCTALPAEIMGMRQYGLAVGCWADLMVVDAETLYDAVVGLASRWLVLKRGRIVAGEHS